jgi:hypothetical protein
VSGRRSNTRYPHVFSKGKGPGFHSQGSWRGARFAAERAAREAKEGGTTKNTKDTKEARPLGEGEARHASSPASGGGGEDAMANDLAIATNARRRAGWGRGGGGIQPPEGAIQPPERSMSLYPIKLDPRRWKYLKVSPTIANLYRGHLGVAVICADCLHGVAHRNPGLPDHFKRQWHLTLIEVEKRCRCEMCGSRNARVYPWWGDNGEGALGLEGPPGGG